MYIAECKHYARNIEENAWRQNIIEHCSNLINFDSVGKSIHCYKVSLTQ